MSDKKTEIIEKRDPSSVAHLAASSGKPPSSSSAGNFIKAEEISFSKSGQWQLNKYGDGMTVSGSGSISPDGGVLAQSDQAPQASSSAIKMYHIHDGAHQITKNPMHLEAINQRFGSTKNLESKGFRLIPVTAPMTKEEMEKQGMVNAPAPRVPPTISGAGAASSVNRPLGKSMRSEFESLEKRGRGAGCQWYGEFGRPEKAHKSRIKAISISPEKIHEHIDSGDEKKGIAIIHHHYQHLTPEHHEKLANHPNAAVKAAYKQKKEGE